jgi:hypothetical protein
MQTHDKLAYDLSANLITYLCQKNRCNLKKYISCGAITFSTKTSHPLGNRYKMILGAICITTIPIITFWGTVRPHCTFRLHGINKALYCAVFIYLFIFLAFNTSQKGYRTYHGLSTFKPTTKLYTWSNTKISNMIKNP